MSAMRGELQGDCNQSIHEYASDAGGWVPGPGCIDLGESHRVGPKTAAFASGLTVRRRQTLAAVHDRDELHAILLFDRASIHRVVPTFCGLLDGLPDLDNVWAVAARHKLPDSPPKTWPHRIGDYWPSYVAPQATASRSNLGAILRNAPRAVADVQGIDEVWLSLTRGVFGLLKRSGWRPDVPPRSPAQFWRAVEILLPGTEGAVRRVLRGVLTARVASVETAVEDLKAVFSRLVSKPMLDDPFLAPRDDDAAAQQSIRRSDDFAWPGAPSARRLRVGTIAAVKGQTHDATLVLETNSGTCLDVSIALAQAFTGRTALGKTAAKAVMNVFVGATRPRYALCLAAGREGVSAQVEAAAREAGWRIVTLVHGQGGDEGAA